MLCVLVVAGLSLMPASSVHATTPSFTWTGDATAPNWSSAQNWEGETAPSSPGPVALTFPRIPTCTDTCYMSTNDLGGLSVESIGLDDGNAYEIAGDEITLGADGLSASPASGTSGPSRDVIDLPVHLGVTQTWNIAGRGDAFGENGVLVGRGITGEASALTVDSSGGSAFYLEGDTEVGAVTFEGANTSGAGIINGLVGLLGADLDSSDGHMVSLNHIFVIGSGAVGPLATNGAEIDVGSPAEGIEASSAKLDSASAVEFQIAGDGTTPGTDNSQLVAHGAIALGGASVGVSVTRPSVKAACPTLAAGQTYTLVSTTGPLSGSFGNVSGGEIPIKFVDSCPAQTAQHVRISYDKNGSTQTVTATAVAPPPPGVPEVPLVPKPENHVTPYERPQEEWIGSRAGQGVAEAEQKQREQEAAREAANKLPAAISIPKGQWCGEAVVMCESGEVALAGTSIAVHGDGIALIELECTGNENCSGKLDLTAKTSSKAKGKKTMRTMTIGTGELTMAAGRTGCCEDRAERRGPWSAPHGPSAAGRAPGDHGDHARSGTHPDRERTPHAAEVPQQGKEMTPAI
jgi:hypothetical protein